jgi:hypothetical protein
LFRFRGHFDPGGFVLVIAGEDRVEGSVEGRDFARGGGGGS